MESTLTPYYDHDIKMSNVRELQARGAEVEFADLPTADLKGLLDGVDVVFHFAAQPGVRHSWDDFESYLGHNLLATQRLLDAARHSSVSRFVFASSSSVYGQVMGAVTERSLTRPFSPYGVTKLAAESLCTTYADNFRVPTVRLRLFTCTRTGKGQTWRSIASSGLLRRARSSLSSATARRCAHSVHG